MLLGKRQRQAIKRTTSLSDIKFELNSPEPSDHQSQLLTVDENRQIHQAGDFLRSCSLCKRFLVPGRDIYMYRGDRAFCSLECRQRQITLDERKEKGAVRSIVFVPGTSAIG